MAPLMPKLHTLKIDTEYYNHVISGVKTFEYRYNDRGYAIGDILHLRETFWLQPGSDPQYTGRSTQVEVTYILPSHKISNCPPGWVIMSIKRLPEAFSRPQAA